MSIELRKTKSRTEFKKMKALYKSAFPAEERAPFRLLKAKANKENVDCLSIYNDGEWIGMLYTVSLRDLSYVFYFAVSDCCRNKGFGTSALTALKNQFSGQRIFLAIEELIPEAENYAERVRRREFYRRNGFQPLNSRLREGRVIYELLGNGGAVTAEEYKELIDNYMGKLMRRFVVMEIMD